MNLKRLCGSQEYNSSPLLTDIFVKNNEQAVEAPSTAIGIWRKNKYIFMLQRPKYNVCESLQIIQLQQLLLLLMEFLILFRGLQRETPEF